MRLAVQHTLAPGDSLSEKFQRAAEYGFDGVELSAWGLSGSFSDHIEAIEAGMQRSGLPVSSLCSGSGDDLVHPDPQVRNDRIQGLVSNLLFADSVGAAGIVSLPIRPPVRLPDLSPVADAHQLISGLTVSAVKSALAQTPNTKANVFLEPLNRYEAYFLRTVGQAAELCESVGDMRATVMADLFHMNIEEVAIGAALEEVVHRVGHIHLADSNRLEPGKGHTDFVAAFRVLRAAGYSGWMALECGLSSDADTALPAAVKFVHDCWEQASA